MLLANFLKAKNMSTGDTVTFNNGGAWVEQTYQGKTSKSLQFLVDHYGEQGILKLNKISKENLKKEWGPDTDKWVGQTANVEIVKALVGGDMIDTIILSA